MACPPPGLSGQWPGEISGRLVDSRTDEGVANARVTVDGSPLAVLSEADGRFLLRPVDEGEAVLRIAHFGYEPVTVRVDIRPGRTRRVTLRLIPIHFRTPEVVVEGRRSPATGTRLDRSAIVASGATSLGEVVSGVPGVSFARRGVGGEETVTIRGAPSALILVLVDGVPLNDPLTGVADLSTVPASRIESVEVLPGARGARFGPGAIGGAILVTTRTGGRGSEGSAGFGSLGERTASLGADVPVGPHLLSAHARASALEGAFSFEQDPRVGGGSAERTNGDVLDRAIRLSFGSPGRRAGRNWDLVAAVSDLRRGVPGKSYAPSPHARQELRNVSLIGRIEGTLGRSARGEPSTAGLPSPAPEASPDFRIRSGIDHRQLSFRDPEPPLGPPFDQRSRILHWNLDAEVDGVRIGGGLAHAGGGVHLHALGLRSDALSDHLVPDADLQGGLFAHAESRRLELPGAPVLHAALRIDRADGGARFSHELALRARIAGVRFHAAHRSTFSPPSPGDQFFREGVGVVPNPDLRPERVPGEVEVGASVAVSPGPIDLHASTVLFRGPIDDHIVWAPDFRFVWSPRNVDVDRRGFTVDSEIRHPGGWSLGGHVTVAQARYRLVDGRHSSQIAYRPRVTGRASLGWDRSGWGVRVSSRYTGARYPVPAPVNELPGFWASELAVSGRHDLGSWRLEPTLRIDRLLDEREPFIFSIPEPGRTGRIEVRIRRGS